MITVFRNEKFSIRKAILGSFENNCYIIECAVTKSLIVIDAPIGIGQVFSSLDVSKIKYLLITHGHFDHIDGLAEIRSDLQNVVIGIDNKDAETLIVDQIDFLKNSQIVKNGELEIKVLSTPGHTFGSVCFLLNDHLFSGDTLFPGGPGRTDSKPSFECILDSIDKKIMNLSETTQIHPGHGISTNLRNEKKQYLGFIQTYYQERDNVYGHVSWTQR
tara:strand:- start:681 stop:1331 length:651 start_codon:yes stop_codon:yes gene_type:complete